ncbi:uncharacterized protein K452DRAFT_36270 [Aplosporella prunicola CBS 121167]|uniref:Uncharacterized protein n=1 Tax=Aplosporella prunicola CBS 121167 TaxID=1176127 RepID=A0A6A6BE48_9PEZI|nr:uncharacterized protein K452DRAFT_36270 [Aplosporella prunicola CBS 121167]KAF2141197.1 hypothetical protein K452DRAFT_36270 [Aplosporella prunicola CBS 121167]
MDDSAPAPPHRSLAPGLQQAAYQNPLALWSSDSSGGLTERLAAHYSLPVVPHTRDGRDADQGDDDDGYLFDDTACPTLSSMAPGSRATQTLSMISQTQPSHRTTTTTASASDSISLLSYEAPPSLASTSVSSRPDSSVDTALASLVPGYDLLEEGPDAVLYAPTATSPETRLLPVYECSFDFLRCRQAYSAANVPDPERAWRTHVLSHFGGQPPPRSVRCPLCDNFEYTDQTPGRAWEKRMTHIAEHHRAGHTLATARPDFHLYQYLWQKRIIDDAELKELKGGSATVSGNGGGTFHRTQGSRVDERTRRRPLHPRR